MTLPALHGYRRDDGRKGIQVAAIYSMDDIKITTGVNYSKLGDADLGDGVFR